MFRTVLFKIVLALHFILWAPVLLIGLVSNWLNRFFVLSCARGVLFWARVVAGIKYEIHYPPMEENRSER